MQISNGKYEFHQLTGCGLRTAYYSHRPESIKFIFAVLYVS